MMPSTTVSDISHERLLNKANVQGFYRMDSATHRGSDDAPSPRMPEAGAMEQADTLLSPERVQAVRKANTEAQMRSNFWYDVSRLAFWATTSLTLLSVMTVAGAGFLAGTSAMLPIIGAVISAGILTASSQFSKRVVTERWFDVQDFQQQRQAALIGKSVEHAMLTQREPTRDDQWVQRTQASREEAAAQQASR